MQWNYSIQKNDSEKAVCGNKALSWWDLKLIISSESKYRLEPDH